MTLCVKILSSLTLIAIIGKMTKIRDKKVDKAYEVYFAIYQGVTGQVGFADTYKEFSPDFFDLIIVDECHRGSAKRRFCLEKILEHFKNATQIGMTATPKRRRTPPILSISENRSTPILCVKVLKTVSLHHIKLSVWGLIRIWKVIAPQRVKGTSMGLRLKIENITSRIMTKIWFSKSAQNLWRNEYLTS